MSDDATSRRWCRGQHATCSCHGLGGPGVVVSSRGRGKPPLLQLDGVDAAHECTTARYVRRLGSGYREQQQAIPAVGLDELTERCRQWLLSLPPPRRRESVIDAIEAAAALATGAESDAESRWCEACQVYRDGHSCQCALLAR